MKPFLLKAGALACIICGLCFNACHTTDNTNSNTTTPPANDKMMNMPDSAHKDKDSIPDGGRLHDNGGAIDTALPTQPTPITK
jgi:succinate dehydrogenase/fumarate reductase-like Fe-S protein